MYEYNYKIELLFQKKGGQNKDRPNPVINNYSKNGKPKVG